MRMHNSECLSQKSVLVAVYRNLGRMQAFYKADIILSSIGVSIQRYTTKPSSNCITLYKIKQKFNHEFYKINSEILYMCLCMHRFVTRSP